MTKLIINGEKKLTGTAKIQGSKNSVLPILAGTILCNGECIIKNCPDLSDVHDAIEILNNLGAMAKFENHTVIVNAKNIKGYEIPDYLMRKMRSSIMFLGAILGRMKMAKISLPGGCDLGSRPIDLHIKALSKMGITFFDEHGYLNCSSNGAITCETINLAFPSVGATENIILAATLANGDTIIHNAAREPEIVDLQNFICSMGGKVKGAGTDTIIISGVPSLSSTEYTIMPDRIVAASYLCAIAITGGTGRLTNINPMHLSSFLSLITDADIKIKLGKDFIDITNTSHFTALKDIRTMPYPGFPTDIQPPLMALMTKAYGESVFIETIFDNRYKHIAELARLGANIKVQGKVALVEGNSNLSGARVCATDLRGGAALVISALAAKGETIIENVFHIDRGYDKIEKTLFNLGADIKRVGG
ncbi:MAG: UDP-N-acetylglucosamine 1-carboxyvinyltransferase [Clostridia bacterium]